MPSIDYTLYPESWGAGEIAAHLADAFGEAEGAIASAGREYPAEYRRARRRAALEGLRAAESAARAAFAYHVRTDSGAAEKTLAQRVVGDPQRALLRELTTQRLVQQARDEDARSGARVVGGRPVPNAAMLALGERAYQMYLDAHDLDSYLDALAVAEAAGAAGADVAATTRAIRGAVDESVPARRDAQATLRRLERESVAFESDVAARTAKIMGRAAEHSRDVGDDPTGFLRQQAALSMRAKATARRLADLTEKPYADPDTGVASAPTGGLVRMPDSQLDRVTANVTTGGVTVS